MISFSSREGTGYRFCETRQRRHNLRGPVESPGCLPRPFPLKGFELELSPQHRQATEGPAQV